MAKCENENDCIENGLEFYQVASQLLPMVKLLRYEGGYPITNNQSSIIDNAQRREAKVSLADIWIKSPQQVSKLFQANKQPAFEKQDEIEEVEYLKFYSWNKTYVGNLFLYATRILIIVALLMFLFNLVFHEIFPIHSLTYGSLYNEYASSTGKTYNDLSISITGVIKVIELTMLFFNPEKLVAWLNNWTDFERDFRKCFGKSKIPFSFDIKQFRNLLLIFYIGLTSILWFGGGVFFISSTLEHDVPVLSAVILGLGIFLLWEYPLTEDFKFFMILRTSSLVTEQIRLGIKCQTEEMFEIQASDVIGWRRLINKTRHQMAIASSYIKSQQLLSSAEVVVSCSLGISYLLGSLSEGDFKLSLTSSAIVGTVYYCFANALRLYLKVLLAEKIPAEELKMAEEILQIEGKSSHPSAKTELKFLHNLLIQETICVNLGNYCTLDKQLMLQVGVQVVTYLIVIIQFQGSSNKSS